MELEGEELKAILNDSPFSPWTFLPDPAVRMWLWEGNGWGVTIHAAGESDPQLCVSLGNGDLDAAWFRDEPEQLARVLQEAHKVMEALGC